MNKELEALEKIKKFLMTDGRLPLIHKVWCEIIETALKRLEKYEEILKDNGVKIEDLQSVCFLYTALRTTKDKDFDDKLKALEIIKAMGIIDVWEDVGGRYHLSTMVDEVGIVKEDYDLLKEVLL